MTTATDELRDLFQDELDVVTGGIIAVLVGGTTYGPSFTSDTVTEKLNCCKGTHISSGVITPR